MYRQEELMIQLERFREAIGHHVHVHSSLKAIGDVDGSGETVLDSLITFFTQQNGTISFPTHTWDKNVLDLRKTDTCTGMLSKLALQRGDGVRTRNTTHSMVIFGANAKEYANWDACVTSSTSPNGCYGRLYDEDGYILLVGVGQEKNTYIHAIEESMQIPNRVTPECFDTTLILEDGKEVIHPMQLVFEEFGDISYQFGKLEPAFRYHHCITDGKLGDAHVQLCNVRAMYAVLERIHKRSNCVELFLDDLPIPKEWYED